MSESTSRAIRVGLAGLWLLVAGLLGITAAVATGVAVDIWIWMVIPALLALGLALLLLVGRGQPVLRLSAAVGVAGVFASGALALALSSGSRFGSLLMAFVFVAITAVSIALLAVGRATPLLDPDNSRVRS